MTDPTADASTFRVTTRVKGDTLRLVVAGELDLQGEPRVVDAVTAALGPIGDRPAVDRPPVERLVVDVTAVAFIDSSGLRALLTACSLARRAGLEASLAVQDGPVTRLLHVAGVAGWFTYE